MPDSESIVFQLCNTLPQVGRLDWISRSPGRGKPLEVVESAQVEVGTGIVGDYHSARGRSKRQVTLIAAEHLEVMGKLLGRDAVDPTETRRNLVVSGINLTALKKQRFRIGEVVFEGTAPCAPCSKMEVALGPGGYNAMRGHGGLCTRVVSPGTIRIGDEVVFLPTVASDDATPSDASDDA